jgi:uncharacterized repeat protein (TIGR03837 family)
MLVQTDFRYKDIDIFCDVVDNFGDAGVTYRLARNLAEILPEVRIRLFTNGMNAFSSLNPDIKGFELLPYDVLNEKFLQEDPPAELIIEAFACHIPDNFYQTALRRECLIINLDHLSAEKWIEGVHLKESLTGAIAKKYFFMPGFNEKSGGLILDRELTQPEKAELRKEFCARFGLDGDGLIASVFTYEHDFGNFITDILSSGKKTELIVFGEKSQKSFEPFLKMRSDKIKIVFSDFITQEEYDALLKVADLNFVRGEDSWARACMSGKPFIWHSYHQEDNYQLVKVKAFNELMKNYFTDNDLYQKYSEYQTAFNDRTDGVKDNSFAFFIKNISGIEADFGVLSKYLIRNCNLIKNLLFFAGSRKEL